MKTRTCLQCSQTVVGRADKKYCSSECRLLYFRNKQSEPKPYQKKIDGILHKNHAILSAIMIGKPNKYSVSRQNLVLQGFDFVHITRIYVNHHGKLYHYIYDYAYMEFSADDIMIVRGKSS